MTKSSAENASRATDLSRQTRETAETISKSLKDTERSVASSGRIRESLESILVKAREVDDTVKQIAAACNEQSQGVSQIVTAVSEIDHHTQRNAAASQEGAAVAESLHARVAAFESIVEHLQALAGGAEAAFKETTPPAKPTGSFEAELPPVRRATREPAYSSF